MAIRKKAADTTTTKNLDTAPVSVVDERRTARAKLLLLTIDEIRAEHHACTAREVARRAKLAVSIAHAQLTILRERGQVAWTEVPGSVRVTNSGRAWVNKHR